MMHRGRVLHDIRGQEKKRIRPAELLERFEEVRRSELLDESAAEMLERDLCLASCGGFGWASR